MKMTGRRECPDLPWKQSPKKQSGKRPGKEEKCGWEEKQKGSEFEFIRDMGMKRVWTHFDSEWTEIVFGDQLGRIWALIRRISKTTKPWPQAKDRIFTGNSRSARTVPLKILTPASRVFVLLNSASKSPEISPADLRKTHPAVCIRSVFCSYQADIVTDNFKFNKQK